MLKRYLRAAWKRGIYSVLLEVLRALRDRDLVEMRIVDRILEDIHRKTVKAMETIGTNGYLKVVSSAEPNLYPLKEMLRQTAQDQAERLRGYRYLVKQFDNPHITIGRRGQDLIRELSMETLEEGFLNGNPSVFTEKKLAEKIIKKGKLYKDEKEAHQALSSLHHDVVRDIPLFHEDGTVKFMLHEKTRGVYQGRYRAWDVERYADLVAVTTAAEADTVANIEHARELGTRLIKWNSTGKGVAFYESIGDTRCAAVDGKVASIVPEGVTINGTHYPYYKELLPGPYSTCHPYCRHRMTPLPEEVSDEYGQPQHRAASEQEKNTETELNSTVIASAKSIRDAEELATSLGVKSVSYGDQKHLEIANAINTVLQQMKSRGYIMPHRVTIDAAHFSGKNYEFTDAEHIFYIKSRRHEMFFNPKEPTLRDGGVTMREQRRINWYSSEHEHHVIYHEFGHMLHVEAAGIEKYKSLRRSKLFSHSIRRRTLVEESVSRYAATDVYEFVAEVFAGMNTGIQYPDEIMRIYAELGGPK